ncbi:hypothetical protein A4X06_0g3777 [Tilletia controversa]|uniref:Nitrogen permease regulator 2 n=1 Tax=Tilletia controversa TaxID=13291 RepID=A0A8X7MTW1_9BASI|nr:hypothetical protein CF328_g530 [Tilletia controversa]KAE8248353.1 hypothetical protein A4X06_0g3777 [Tilletia controversa]
MSAPGLLGGAFDVESNAFLDIQCIFFAVFHPTHGPQILFQMPEQSITQDHPPPSALPPSPSAPSRRRRTPKKDTHSNEPLFDFGPIKDYIIPKKQLCGRLVACNIRGRSSNAQSARQQQNQNNNNSGGSKIIRSSFSSSNRSSTSKVRSDSVSRYTTASDIEEDDVHLEQASEANQDPTVDDSPPPRPTRNYKILGFPVFLSDESRYDRNDFRFNMCFVFDASADTRPYEPVIRKIARILTGLEQSSCFLSNEKSRNRIYGIIEQLYQDLNSYCESFVPLPVAPHTSYVPRNTAATEAAGTPTAGAAQGVDLFIPRSANNTIVTNQPTANNTPFTQSTPFFPSNPTASSPSPSRISTIRGRRRGRTIDGIKRATSVSFTPGTPGTRSTGYLTPDTSTANVSATPLSPQQEADAKLEEWEKELPHGLGRTVRDAINIKLFPTYPNPPAANDWDVPVALLDLRSRVDDNWDLTMKKIFPFINGVNHVKRIAELADADLALTRQCMEHLLYYECIIMIDLFQFSNVYTLRPLIASVATLDSIQRECADYVIRPGKPRLPYSDLLKLYASALRPGLTVSQWMEDLAVDKLNVDVRRFVTFGVIKGFVRRVHRFPIYTPPSSAAAAYPLPLTTKHSPTIDLRTAGLSTALPGLEEMLIEGTHCDDELCVRFGLSWLQLERMLLTIGYGEQKLAEEMEEQRSSAAVAEMRARAEEEAAQAQGRSLPTGGGRFGSGTSRYSVGGGSGSQASYGGHGHGPGQGPSQGQGQVWGWGANPAPGSTLGISTDGSRRGGSSAWGSSTDSDPYARRQSGASAHHRQGSSQGHRTRHPSDAGWGSVSSFGAHMSGFQYPQARNSVSEGMWAPPEAGAATGSGAGAGTDKGAYDRVTGERLPANARPRSPSPVPGPDWSAVYTAARTCGHMGDVQIFLR